MSEDQCRQKLTWEPAEGGMWRRTARCERDPGHPGPHSGQGYTWGKFGVIPPGAPQHQGGAVVEIVDPNSGTEGPLVPTQVLINGVHVGYVAKDSLRIKPGNHDTVTEVSLTLLPSRVVIRGAEA